MDYITCDEQQQQGVQKIILRLLLQNEYDTKGVYPFRVS